MYVLNLKFEVVECLLNNPLACLLALARCGVHVYVRTLRTCVCVCCEKTTLQFCQEYVFARSVKSVIRYADTFKMGFVRRVLQFQPKYITFLIVQLFNWTF